MKSRWLRLCRSGVACCRTDQFDGVDIGGGTTEVAVISLAGIVYSKSVRVAGDKIDGAIVQYMKRKHNLLIGERTAEIIKMEIGCAYPFDEIKACPSSGGSDFRHSQDYGNEFGRNTEAINEQVTFIVDAIKDTLENSPPELAGDIVDRGIVLTGGGALLANIDILIREETGLPITITDDPLSAVARGAGMALEQINVLKDIALEV